MNKVCQALTHTKMTDLFGKKVRMLKERVGIENTSH